MKVSVKITNETLYNERVIEVETNNVKNVSNNSFNGNVAIEVENEGWREYDGEHGMKDYEDEFGFIFIAE